MDSTDAATDSPARDTLIVNPAVVPLDALLVAFQTLQMQNAHASSVVASGLGISATDMRALLFIASGEGVTPKRTGDYLELTSGAITNLIDRMVAVELIQRVPHPVDRRSIMLELAPGGIGAVGRIVELYRRAFEASVAPENIALLAGTFGAIGDALTLAVAEPMASSEPA